MAKYKILTFNCNGIRDESKRRQVFNYLRTKGADIILLQEVHSTENIEKIWQNEWGGGERLIFLMALVIPRVCAFC